jgi:hypothetical protein
VRYPHSTATGHTHVTARRSEHGTSSAPSHDDARALGVVLHHREVELAEAPLRQAVVELQPRGPRVWDVVVRGVGPVAQQHVYGRSVAVPHGLAPRTVRQSINQRSCASTRHCMLCDARWTHQLQKCEARGRRQVHRHVAERRTEHLPVDVRKQPRPERDAVAMRHGVRIAVHFTHFTQARTSRTHAHGPALHRHTSRRSAARST